MSLILLFIELNNLNYNIKINKNGLLPIHISLIYNHYTIALLVKNYFDINDNEIDNIPEKYKKQLEKFRSSNLTKEKEKIKNIIKYLK